MNHLQRINVVSEDQPGFRKEKSNLESLEFYRKEVFKGISKEGIQSHPKRFTSIPTEGLS